MLGMFLIVNIISFILQWPVAGSAEAVWTYETPKSA